MRTATEPLMRTMPSLENLLSGRIAMEMATVITPTGPNPMLASTLQVPSPSMSTVVLTAMAMGQVMPATFGLTTARSGLTAMVMVTATSQRAPTEMIVQTMPAHTLPEPPSAALTRTATAGLTYKTNSQSNEANMPTAMAMDTAIMPPWGPSSQTTGQTIHRVAQQKRA